MNKIHFTHLSHIKQQQQVEENERTGEEFEFDILVFGEGKW